MAKGRGELSSHHPSDSDPQLPPTSLLQPPETTESVVDTSVLSKKAEESSPDVPVEEVDLTDKAVRKLVEDLLDQLVLEVDGTNEKVEREGDEAKALPSADTTAFATTAPDTTAINNDRDYAQTKSGMLLFHFGLSFTGTKKTFQKSLRHPTSSKTVNLLFD